MDNFIYNRIYILIFKRFRGALKSDIISDTLKFFSNRFVINENMSANKALGFMSEKKITSLLVVSDKDLNKKNKKLKGIIHIHFLLKNGIR